MNFFSKPHKNTARKKIRRMKNKKKILKETEIIICTKPFGANDSEN